MRFASTARRIKYVVKAKYRTMGDDGQVTPHPGLAARFLNHAFDSDKSQTELGWTDEQRKMVENHLLAHKDFDRPGGIFLDTAAGESKADILRAAGHPMAEQMATKEQPRCLFFFRNNEGEAEQCPHIAVAESDYCIQHSPEQAEPQPHPVQDVPEEPIEAEGWKAPAVGVG